jgi:transposase
MAEKGDRAKLEPTAKRLYIDGLSLTEIEERIGVSRQTLSVWKKRTQKPGEDSDEWDRARENKRGRAERLRSMFDEQMDYIEGLQPSARDSKLMDSLSKLCAIVERWDSLAEKERQRLREEALREAAENVKDEAKRQGASAATIDSLRSAIMQGLNA